MPEENVGPLDAYLRITAGLALFGWGVTRRQGGVASGLMMAVGAMRVAEGVTRWCPVLELIGKNTLNWGRSARHPYAGRMKGYAEEDFLTLEGTAGRKGKGPLRWAGNADERAVSDAELSADQNETGTNGAKYERARTGRIRVRRSRKDSGE